MSDYECTECGAEVNESANFCPNCGEKFDGITDDAFEVFECSTCMTDVDESATVCPNCGEYFE